MQQAGLDPQTDVAFLPIGAGAQAVTSSYGPMSHIPSTHRECPAPGLQECVRRSDDQVARAASRKVPVDQHVALGGVGAVMLEIEIEIAIESAYPPLHDREYDIKALRSAT